MIDDFAAFLRSRKFSRAKRLIKKNPQLLKTQDLDGNLPLHLVARSGGSKRGYKFAIWILSQDEDALYQENQKKELPIHCIHSDSKWLSIIHDRYCVPLFKKMAFVDSNLIEPQVPSRHCPIHQLVFFTSPCKFHLKIWEDILEKDPALLWQRDSEQELPIHYAIEDHNFYLFDLFIRHDEDLLQEISLDPWTLFSIVKKRPLIFQKMAMSSKDILYQADEEGNLPIHRVLDLRLLKWMVEQDPELLFARNDVGNLPIHTAAEEGLLSLLKWSIHKCPDLIQVHGKRGNTLMHSAAKSLCFDCFKWVYDQDSSMLTEQNVDQETPVRYALRLHDFPTKRRKKFCIKLKKLGAKDGWLQSL